MNKYCMALVFFDEQFQSLYARKTWIRSGDMNPFTSHASFVLRFSVNSQATLTSLFTELVDKKATYFDFEAAQVFRI